MDQNNNCQSPVNISQENQRHKTNARFTGQVVVVVEVSLKHDLQMEHLVNLLIFFLLLMIIRHSPITHWPIIGRPIIDAKQSADYRLIQKVPETGQKPAVHTV